MPDAIDTPLLRRIRSLDASVARAVLRPMTVRPPQAMTSDSLVRSGAPKVGAAAQATAFRHLVKVPLPVVVPPLPAGTTQEPVTGRTVAQAKPWSGPAPKLTHAQVAIIEASERGKRDRLVQAIKSDPMIKAGLAGWTQLTRAERMAVLERIAAIQGKVYAFTPAPMSLRAPDNDKTYGDYDEDTGLITLDRTYMADANPENMVDTVIHEQLHAYQHQKLVAFQDGELPEGDHPVTMQARVWQWNYTHYQNDTDEQYRRNPVESHAWAWANAATSRLRDMWGGQAKPPGAPKRTCSTCPAHRAAAKPKVQPA